MDFNYTQEQQMLVDSLGKILSDHWTFEQRRKRQLQAGVDQDSWEKLSDIGITGLVVPEDFGGFSESASTLLLVHRELGHFLVSEPVITSTVLSVVLLNQIQEADIKADLLSKIASGDERISVAYQESNRQSTLDSINTRATYQDNYWLLDGVKNFVASPKDSNYLIVSALCDDEIALFLVPTHSEGITITEFPTMDRTLSGSVDFHNTKVPEENLLLKGRDAQTALQQAIDWSMVALSAQAVGAIEHLLQVTIDYLNTRQQFGQALAKFQVLSQTIADMYVQKETALAMAYTSVMALNEEVGSPQRIKLLSSAKIKIALAARFIGETAIQLHGGIGMTDELEVGDYCKRLTYYNFLFGSTEEHLEQLSQLHLASVPT